MTTMMTRTLTFFSFLSLLLLIPNSLQAADDDRANKFYGGEKKQKDEERAQKQKALVKLIQKQGLEMQRDTTQDPGRKQQLQQQIDKLQREITQHQQQAQALNDHAKKANHAAKQAEAGKAKKGRQKKGRRPSGSAPIANQSSQISTDKVETAQSNSAPTDEDANVVEDELVNLEVDEELSFEDVAASNLDKMTEIAALGGVQLDGSETKGDKGLLFMDEGLEDQEREVDKPKGGRNSASSEGGRPTPQRTIRTSSGAGSINRILPASPRAAALGVGAVGVGEIDAGRDTQGKLKPKLPSPPINSRALHSSDLVEALRALSNPDFSDSPDIGSLAGGGELVAQAGPGPGIGISLPEPAALKSAEGQTDSPSTKKAWKNRQAFVYGSTRTTRHRLSK